MLTNRQTDIRANIGITTACARRVDSILLNMNPGKSAENYHFFCNKNYYVFVVDKGGYYWLSGWCIWTCPIWATKLWFIEYCIDCHVLSLHNLQICQNNLKSWPLHTWVENWKYFSYYYIHFDTKPSILYLKLHPSYIRHIFANFVSLC